MENYLRRGVRGVRYRVGKRLDRAAVSRAHDVLYLSDAWTEATWLGAQALKNPLDLWVYQEIMVETRPELVVETGTYRGGSAFFLASICDLLGAGEVVSIDVEPVRDDYPAHPRITYLGGRSSTDPDVVAEVRARAEGKRVLVILDSDHSQAHVEAELAEYALARPGRRLPDRRGLEHRADPRRTCSRARSRRSRRSSPGRTSSRSTARARSS